MVCANICRDHFIGCWIRSKWNFYQIDLKWKTLVIWAHDPNELNVWMIHGINSLKHVTYRKTSNISRILVGNKIVDHSDVVAPITSSFST